MSWVSYKTSPKNREPLQPRTVINVKGKIHYGESNQAWNTIKLKSEFLNEFKQLKEKRSTFSYEMMFGRSDCYRFFNVSSSMVYEISIQNVLRAGECENSMGLYSSNSVEECHKSY